MLTSHTIVRWSGGRQRVLATHRVEAVVEDMFQVFAHANLSHQLVLVAVHARQLADVCKDVLQSIGQLQLPTTTTTTCIYTTHSLNNRRHWRISQ